MSPGPASYAATSVLAESLHSLSCVALGLNTHLSAALNEQAVSMGQVHRCKIVKSSTGWGALCNGSLSFWYQENMAYKLSGAGSSSFSPQAFLHSSSPPACSHSIRQHGSDSVHKSPRWHQFSPPFKAYEDSVVGRATSLILSLKHKPLLLDTSMPISRVFENWCRANNENSVNCLIPVSLSYKSDLTVAACPLCL